MSILINTSTRVIVQGITGREGSFHARQMLNYGTRVVAGVTPGKGGQSLDQVPIYDDVATAVRDTGANTSIIYVPARFAVDAILEAADSGLQLIVCITEGIPVQDTSYVLAHLRRTGTRLLGPNCPGLITPGECKVGIMPAHIHRPGRVGVVSRSGTLTYEVVWALTQAGFGQSTAVGIGGDPLTGMDFCSVLELFQQDPGTEVVVMIGEIGGSAEEEAAAYLAAQSAKPVVAFVAGRSAPPDKRMGHAGAIVAGGQGRAEDKRKALEAAGVLLAEHPEQIVQCVKEALN